MSKLKSLLALALMLACFALNAAEAINLNTADAETLATSIDGIGSAKAAAIVAFRDAHGPFKTVDDLLLVKGIGAATLKKNRQRLTAATP